MPRGSTTTACISCKAVIGVATKTCKACNTLQPRKQRLAKKLQKFEAKKEGWLKNQRKNKTTSHVMDEASILLEKLSTLGFRAVLFTAKPAKKPATWVTSALHPKWQLSEQAAKCLDRMKALYEVLVNGWTDQQHEPSTSAGTQPSTASAVQPSTSSAIQPCTYSVTQPSTSAGTQPATASAVQPSTSSAIQPCTYSVTQPSTASAIQPATTSAVQPSTSSAFQPCTYSVTQPSTSAGTQPATASAIQPSTSSAIQPCTSSVTQPSTSSAIQPCTSSVTQPSSSAVTQPSTAPAFQTPTSPAHITATKKNQGMPPRKKTKKNNNKDLPQECSHMVRGEDQYFPVKRVVKTKIKKGNQMELVEWEPCSICGKTWPLQWVEKEHTV
ncbi:G8 domain-containing protein DDB_G0286311-like [Notolabrus celidotus]|uniref:G8 domain-containing protein DDB_G0286311-like n=1 Tax=Notolabrus celidotus TaxID=1203425 RepID=UPI0014907403|nr:G8 domain-containing protein DDB_G0286311-like [Notolabrus celidotus]